ncbi:class I SAM-dependent methyltransferase [Streptacidiphilus jiangxiensis]|uniref:Ubiquinone/menaquinone biosynthesis C-methylase UbiE n=1 Tax=Streptacidiphilus jiangxiensis TaxID=235985 RepID=A0A1H7NCP7_STRJI|nr:class I SAM-dependent methyltransferase [Streptacidiphilus jiangxiensis]SEL21366.1 Ubiquinone/menaquinone biosynthesis C-methylase UbiE [Streptacidiphilus jiangxiensis]
MEALTAVAADPGRGARGSGAAYAELRGTLLGLLRGTVLEIGAGATGQLAQLDPEVRWLGLEPSARRRRRLARRAAEFGRPGSVLAGRAEELPLTGGSVDAVLASVVLCSVRDQERVLAEIRRVLRPGGLFVFFEHVGAPEGSAPARLQRAWAPWSRVCDGGCDPRRPTARRIAEAGFGSVDLRFFDLGGRFTPYGPYVAGCAARQAEC